MAEFSIIERFCTNIGVDHAHTKLAVGDDAAIVAIPAGMELAISADTMVEGTHFLPDTDPALLAHKILTVNLSDMAAMGAKPKWATLALTLPSLDEQWLAEFSKALNNLAETYNVQIIGGDTTQGPLNLCMNIMGLLPKGQNLSRSGAGLGDDLYVSNTLGDAALALSCIIGDTAPGGLDLEKLRIALDTPSPQVSLGQALLEIASACLDISDGLIADIGHIAKQSKVSFEIDTNQIPLSAEYQDYLKRGGNLDLALSGGDDYQLAFTAKPIHRAQIKQLSEELGIALSIIGKVVEANATSVKLLSDNQPYALGSKFGYEHFKS